MEILTGQVDGVSVVGIRGDIDGSTAPAAQARMLPLIQPGCKLVLNMAEVDHMSSAGLRLLLLLYRQVHARGGRVALACLPPDIRDTMSLTGFLDFFATCDTVEAAVAEVKG